MGRAAQRVLMLVLAAGPLGLSGCKLGPDFTRPVVPTPVDYRGEELTEAALSDLEWADVFQDPALCSLIEATLRENRDLLAASWRIEEARARLGFVRADLFPSFQYRAGARSDQPSDASLAIPIPLPQFETYTLTAGVSWEIDLWGKLRRATESARSQLLSTVWSRRALTVSLIAEVARLYFVLRDLDARLEIARRTLASRHDSTELIRSRFRGGIVSELDVRQAEIQESIAAVAVPAFEREVVKVENALSVLIGRNPEPIVRGETLVNQDVPASPPAGLPSELLQRRPDVRQSEEQLHVQMARIGVAQALRFPSLNLTGFLGRESAELSDITTSDADTWGIGLDLIGPIFEFGKNKRRVQAQRARTEQALLQYEATVLDAFREVEDALISIRTLRQEYEVLQGQVASARQASFLSRARYDGGVTSYLEVLENERSLFDAELQASRTLQEHYSAIVDLYAALGGGWEGVEEEAENRQAEISEAND